MQISQIFREKIRRKRWEKIESVVFGRNWKVFLQTRHSGEVLKTVEKNSPPKKL